MSRSLTSLGRIQTIARVDTPMGDLSGNTWASLVAGGAMGLHKARHWWNKDNPRKIMREGVFRTGQNNRGWARRHTIGFNTVANARGSSFDYHNDTRSTDYLITITEADFAAGVYKEHRFEGKLQPTLNPAAVARLGLHFRNTGKALDEKLPAYPWKQIMEYRERARLPSHVDDAKPRTLATAVPWGEMSATQIFDTVKNTVQFVRDKVGDVTGGGSGGGSAPIYLAKVPVQTVTGTLTMRTTPSPSSLPPTPPDSREEIGGSGVLGLPLWAWAGLGLGALAVGGVVLYRRRSR